MLRAEVRAVARRLNPEQILELAEILSETAGGGEPLSWRPDVASPR
ncbi:hypothetical protein [Phenylobacterium sp. J367]|nr:hypothetical protein [Phenylobacterium sp. J367]MCR5879333.1 hypothetical protein [Phenylobacterium sp. J367]